MTTEDTSWMQHGLCRDCELDVFYPVDPVGVDEAKAICFRCPARVRCADYAIRNREEHGVWGGTSGPERRDIWRKRGMRKPSSTAAPLSAANPKDVETVVRRHRLGATPEQIAVEFHVTPKQVCELLHRAGIWIRAQQRGTT